MISDRSGRKPISRAGGCLGLLLAVFLLPICKANADVHGVDWKGLPLTEMTLFHPGQASLQWVLDPAHHTGAAGFRQGRMECLACHLASAAKMGKKVMHSRELEPAPLLWRHEHILAAVQMHFEQDALHLRVRFPQAKLQPEDRMQDVFESRLTVMISDEQVRSAQRAGCWAACHADMRDMPAAAGHDIGKYIIDSRPKPGATGGGPVPKPGSELDALYANGTFLEIWQANLVPEKPLIVRDGHILEDLHFHEVPVVRGQASLVDSVWTVELDRAVSAEGKRIQFELGKVYTIGLALHDQYTAGRYHLVSQTYRFTMLADGVRFEPLL